VVVSFVLSKWLAGPPAETKVPEPAPEPAEANVPPQVRSQHQGEDLTTTAAPESPRSGDAARRPVARPWRWRSGA
jgi:hypothetical protein